MTIARTAALVLTALIFGPAATLVASTGALCLLWAWRNECRCGRCSRKKLGAIAAT